LFHCYQDLYLTFGGLCEARSSVDRDTRFGIAMAIARVTLASSAA
jgi:hypothetical protein